MSTPSGIPLRRVPHYGKWITSRERGIVRVSGFATVEFIGNGEPEPVPSPYGIAEYMPEPTKCQVSGPMVSGYRCPSPLPAGSK